MDLLEFRWLPLRKLRLPGTFPKRLREPRVVALSESIAVHGLWLPVLVRRKDGRVLDGFDRVAAYWLQKRNEIPALLCDCTDEEALLIESKVNTERRHDQEEQRKKEMELIDRIASEEAAREAEEEAKRKKYQIPGRPKTPKRRALERVSGETGVPVNTLKQRIYRERRRKGLTGTVKELRTLGMVIPQTLSDEVRVLQGVFDEAILRAKQALSCLTTIETQGYPYPPARLQRLRADAQELSASLRNARPDCLCPYCKAVEALKAGCAACLGCGFITANQVSGVPKELLDEENPMVMAGGQIRSAWDYIPETPPAPPVEADPFGLGDDESEDE